MLFEPIPIELFILIYIASSYGTDVQVALNTDWSHTFSSDPDFKNNFWAIFFANLGQFYVGLKLRSKITQELNDGAYLSKINAAGCVDEEGNPTQCTVAQD